MGKLVDGVWKDVWYDTKASKGRFVRSDTTFRAQISTDPGAQYPAEAGRYHLYVSYACPWAHRTLIARALLGLSDVIGVSVVEPLMLAHGWTFSAQNPDHLGGREFLHQVYTDSDPHYTGRVTVPVLWDDKTRTIVNNESAQILRFLNGPFAALVGSTLDLYPVSLREEIDGVNALVYEHVNNGVYRAGFATTQEAYEEAMTPLFDTLHMLERRLEGVSYLVGDTLTEADIRLFTTLVRFDAVYHSHFKCNVRRIADLPNLWRLTRRLYQLPGIAATVHFDHIKQHYFGSHKTINPTGIVPLGPELDWRAPV